MDEETAKDAFRVALETRNMEIGLFWQRSNYFLVLNTGIAIAFLGRGSHDGFQLVIALLGLVVCTLWVLANLGSKFWQVRWEQRLHAAELAWRPELNLFSATMDAVREDVATALGETRNPLLRAYNTGVRAKPSVTQCMTALSALFVAFWLAALVYTAVT